MLALLVAAAVAAPWLARGESLALHLAHELRGESEAVAAAAAGNQVTLAVPGITSLEVGVPVVLQVVSVPSGTAPSIAVTSTFPSTISFATYTQGAGAYVLYGFTSQATQQKVTGFASATLSVPDGQLLNALTCNVNAYCTVPNGVFFNSSSSLTSTTSGIIIVQQQSLAKITATAETSGMVFVTSAAAATSGTLDVSAQTSGEVCIQGPLFSSANAAQCTLSASTSGTIALAGANFGSSGALAITAQTNGIVNSCALISSSATINAQTSSIVSATVNGAVSGSATTSSTVNLAGTFNNGITTSTSGVVTVGCEASPDCKPPAPPSSYTNVYFCPQQEGRPSCSGGGPPTTGAACTIRVAATMLALTALLV
jgi:hypothetical protein